MENTPKKTPLRATKRRKKEAKLPTEDLAQKPTNSKGKQPATEPKRPPPIPWAPGKEALYIRLMTNGVKSG